jgi:glycosyltransferase involved in cell wall biosynthesis
VSAAGAAGARFDADPRAGLPFVSVVLPVRNEAPYIAANVAAALAQDYPPERFEVIVADGRSSDGTSRLLEDLAAAEPRLVVVDNPARIVSAGLNRALAASRGDVIVRMDGHCEYPADYVRRVVALREKSGAANAGGVLEPVGRGYVQRSICAALASRVGVGGSALRAQGSSGDVRDVDAVHGGCWLASTLREAGGFDESMVRNQDDELSFRLRRRGGRVVQACDLRVRYVVRDRWRKLFVQFAQYGYWKVRLVRNYPGQASARHLTPALLVLAFAAGLAAAPFSGFAAILLGALAAAYAAGVAAAAAAVTLPSAPRLWPGAALALVLMHAGYGCGFLAGLVRAPSVGREGFFSRLSR